MNQEEYEKALKEDFRNFLAVVWEALRLPEPSRVQYDMADYLQDPAPRKMIQAMRNAGKSYITAAYCVWELYRNPDVTILCISAVQNRAREFLRLCRKIIEAIEQLEPLRPKDEDRDGADRFDVGCRSHVDKNPSVAAYGIKAMLTGSHADIIICDDIEIPQNSQTAEARELLLARTRELESVSNPGGRIVFLGTPQSFDSIYTKLSQDYPLRRWPARYPLPDYGSLSPLLLHDLLEGRAKVGDPTYPEYHTHEILLQREGIMGSSVFALQMQLDTSLQDGLLHPLDIPIPIREGSQHEEAQRRIGAIDPSGKGKDKTALTILLLQDGKIHVPIVRTWEDGSDPQTLSEIGDLLQFWGIKEIFVESNFGAGLFEALLESHLPHRATIIPVRHNTQKEWRIIDTLQPIIESGRLSFSPEAGKHKELLFQLKHITRQRGSLIHDDCVDSLALGCSQLKDGLSQDPQVIINNRTELQKKKAVADFLASFAKAADRSRPSRGGFSSVDRASGGAKPRGGPSRRSWFGRS